MLPCALAELRSSRRKLLRATFKAADRFEVESPGDTMVNGKQNAVRVYRVTGVKQG